MTAPTTGLDQANRKPLLPLLGLKWVYVFGLKSTVLEGKSARFTFSRGWAHLQRLAYESEARLYQDWTIPALTQSLESLQQEFASHTILKAMRGGQLVGTVRAQQREQTCVIGRLAVHPSCQGQGIGTRLLAAIESHFAAAHTFVLFTGSKSEANLRLYQRHGYAITHTKTLSPTLSMTYLAKQTSPSE